MHAEASQPLVALNWRQFGASAWLANLAFLTSFAVAQLTTSQGSAFTLLLAMAAVNAWIALWALLDGVQWERLLSTWQTWRGEVVLPSLPYTLPESDAEQARRHLGALIAWAQATGRATSLDVVALSVLTFATLSLLASIGLGTTATALSGLALLGVQANVWARRRIQMPLWNIVWQATLGALRAGLPVLLGYAIVAPPSWALVALSIGLALVASPQQHWRALGGAAVIVLLLATRQPIGAFLVAQIWLPQLLLGNLRAQLLWQSLIVGSAVLTLS